MKLGDKIIAFLLARGGSVVVAGSGFIAYLFFGTARPLPLLIFCGLVVGVIGGTRMFSHTGVVFD